MGRTGTGVETRERSIRFTFLPGKPTLQLNGRPMPPTPANVRYAHRLAAEIREKIKHGTFSMAEYFPANGEPGTLTVGAQLDAWLAAQRIAHSTKAGYESAIKFWKASGCDDKGTQVGALPVRALKLSHILTALANRPELSGKTVNNYVSVLREALELAVSDKVLTENPAADKKKLRAKWQQEPPDPFTPEEREQIIAYAAKHYPEPIYNLIEWWFFSGPRTSEMAGLRWASVNMAGAGAFKVHEALVRGVEKKDTKTSVARLVRLNSRSKAALQRQAKHTRMAGEHVWLDPRYGTPWVEERAFRRSYWTPMLKVLGIRYRRPYNMRHTYATFLLMAGLKVAFCAKQMGHSVEVFLRTYAKWIEGDEDDRQMADVEAAIKADNTQKVAS